MIFAEEKIAYIHIPKTAGTSITAALNGKRDHSTLRHYLPLKLNHVKSAANFNKAEFKLLAKILKSKLWDREKNICIDKEWRLFTIVRNPWSRCLSWWLDVRRHHPHRAKLNIDENIDLQDFIYKYYNRSMGLIPQTYWLKDWEGKIEVFDLIIKQEALREDWIKVQNLLNTSASLPYLNAAPKKYKCEDFYTARTVDLVSELFHEEIMLFNYEYNPIA